MKEAFAGVERAYQELLRAMPDGILGEDMGRIRERLAILEAEVQILTRRVDDEGCPGLLRPRGQKANKPK